MLPRGLASEGGMVFGAAVRGSAGPLMLAPVEDDPERLWDPRPGRRRYWRDLGLRAAALACVLLAALLAVVGLATAILE